MHRQVTVLYVSFFLVVAAGAFTSLAMIDQPTISVENPDYTLNAGQKFTIDGQSYNVTAVSAQRSQGELVRSATAEWTNSSARYTETWQNNSTVTYQNSTYRVVIQNKTDPSEAVFQEVQNFSDNTTTVEQNGERYVVVNESDGNKSLVPVSEYKQQRFGEPDTRRLTEGANLQYHNNSTTISNVGSESITVSWTAPRTNTLKLGETTAIKTTLVRGGMPTEMQYPAGGSNVTLNGQTFTVHYPNNETLVLSSQSEQYQQRLNEINHATERIAGLWGVFILSTLAAILFVILAFLPNK